MQPLKEIVNSAFIIYARCEVEYNGRADSTLEIGNYLIIRKNDGCLLIHGSTKCPPLNYQGAKSKIELVDSTLIIKRKAESITIKLHKLMDVIMLDEWTVGSLKLRRSEKDLVAIFLLNPRKYLGWEPNYVETEHPTEFGPVDVMCKDILGGRSIIEFKRNKITTNHCLQLKKYIEALGGNVTGYLAAPAINEKAVRYCEEYGYKYIKVDYD